LIGFAVMRNQPSGWFFLPAGFCGCAAAPKILNKKNFSDDWQVLEPPCKKIYTDTAEFSPDFRFSTAL